MEKEIFELVVMGWALLLLVIGILGGVGFMHLTFEDVECESEYVFVSAPSGLRHDPLYVVKGVDGLAFKN